MALKPENRALIQRATGHPVERLSANQVVNQHLDRIIEWAVAEGEERGVQKAEQNRRPINRGSAEFDAAVQRARAEGEEAGTIKAEHAAADTIARLESRLVAAIYATPSDVRCGHLRKEADRITAERASMKVQLAAAEMELGHAIERLKRAEVEVERFEALQDALDAWAMANGTRVFMTSHGHMQFPRRGPIRFTKPQPEQAAPAEPIDHVIGILRDHMGEMAKTGRVALTDADIAMFWPGEDPAKIRRQYRSMWVPAQ